MKRVFMFDNEKNRLNHFQNKKNAKAKYGVGGDYAPGSKLALSPTTLSTNIDQ